MIHMNAFEIVYPSRLSLSLALSHPYVHETNVVSLFHVVFDEASDSRTELGPVVAVWGGLKQLYNGHRFTLAEEKRKRSDIYKQAKISVVYLFPVADDRVNQDVFVGGQKFRVVVHLRRHGCRISLYLSLSSTNKRHRM